MAKQTRLATTLTARYFPTAELTDAFYMDGRVTSKTVSRSADLTNDKEDRGFFFSIFSHQTIPDYDPNTLPPYEPVLRRLGTELKSGRRSLDDQIGEMVNTATSITGRMKIQQDNNRAPFFAGVIVKDAEAFAITIGKGLAFLYRDDTLYPMTANDIRIDAINTQRQKVDNFYNFCATKTAPALCSNIAQLKLDDCIILCNREVYEALGQQELLRILYDAEDQSDAASVVITEAAAKLPGVPLQFMISFVEDITSSDRGGFFGFGRKKKKEVEPEEEYEVAPAIPLDSPEPKNQEVPKDAVLFMDEERKDKTPMRPGSQALNAAGSAASKTASAGDAAAKTAAAGAAGAAAVAGAAAASAAGKGAGAADSVAKSVNDAINTPIPEPPLTFGDIDELMKEEAEGKSAPVAPKTEKTAPFTFVMQKKAEEATKPATPAVPATPATPAPVAPSASVDNDATKVVPIVSDSKPLSFGDTGIVPPVKEEPAASPFVQAKAPAAPEIKEVIGEEKKDEPFVAVKNSENPFFKAAVKAQNEENKQEAAPAPAAEIPVTEPKAEEKAEEPLFLGDDPFGGIAIPQKPEAATAEQAPEVKAEMPASGAVAETDESTPIVFEADSEVSKPMNDEELNGNDPKKFDETPLFFGDAEPAPDENPLDAFPADYEPASSINPAPAQEPADSDEFVIPFASNEAPSVAQASSNDIPEMPLYEAPSYVPPTYPTNSDTPVGYEDTGVYARGSYTVDEDEVTPSFQAGTPVSPYAAPQNPTFGDSDFGGVEVPAAPEDYATGAEDFTPSFDQDAGYTPSTGDGYTSFAEPGEDPFAAIYGDGANVDYTVNNPPPAVADFFDNTPSSTGGVSFDDEPAGMDIPSSVPAYMQQNSVAPSAVPGVPKRTQQGTRPGSRPAGRPNAQPARRGYDDMDDGFDEGDEEVGPNYLPYILAAISVICLIVIIILIAHSCNSDKKEETSATTTPSITTEQTTTESETTPETTPEVTASPTDPIGVFTFSGKSGCRTWWDLFNRVYNIKIDSESDKRVAFILEYNGKDSSYKPQEGDQIMLPPVAMLPTV